MGINIIKGVSISLAFTLICLFIFSCLLVYTDISESLMSPVVIVITGISILLGSSIGNRKATKNGILNGAIVGGLYMLIIYILSSICNEINFTLNLQSIIMILSRYYRRYNWWNYWGQYENLKKIKKYVIINLYANNVSCTKNKKGARNMTIEKRLQEFGVRLVNSNNGFVEQNQEAIENLLLINASTEAIFKILVARGYKDLEIIKKEAFISMANEALQFLFATQNWVLVVDIERDTLVLCKI